MPEFKNIYIYVSDALRYDHIPESIAKEGNVIPTLTPASYTPISFSSMLTGLNPSKHNVRSFHDTIENKTFLDMFENHCYYDHPDGAMSKNVFKNYTTSKELEDMEEPFLYVERALDTHYPYGEVNHGNELPKAQNQDGDIDERYDRGVNSTEKHFWEHIQKLKNLGLYEDTLIIFTSDHGELLDEKRLFRKRRGHNKPVCKELNIVPTVFLNHSNSWDRIRLIDLVATAIGILGERKPKDIDGKDLTREKSPKNGESMVQLNRKPPLIATSNWYFRDEWSAGLSKIKTDLATLLSDLIDPLKKKLRNNKKDEKHNYTRKEIEGIDV